MICSHCGTILDETDDGELCWFCRELLGADDA